MLHNGSQNRKELSLLKDDNEKLTKDKSQILKERDQLLDEVACLKIELAEKGIL